MRALVTPEYKDLFGDNPTIEELLNDIPSATLIQILCWINAQLHNPKNGIKTDVHIFKTLMGRVPEPVRDEVVRRFLLTGSRDSQSRFFIPMYVTYFLHYELQNYRPGSPLENTTPVQDFNILRAYLLIVTKYYQRNSLLPEVDRQDREFFVKRTWPFLTIQFEFNRYVDPFSELMKLYALLDYLENGEFKDYASRYYALFGCASGRDMIKLFAEVMKLSFKTTGQDTRYSRVTVSSEYVPLMNLLNHETSSSQGWEPGSLLSMKKKPLFRVGENEYCVLNWNFFYLTVYQGVLRDFFARSGVEEQFGKDEHGKAREVDFTGRVSKDVIERRIFKAVVKLLFNGKHDVLHFDSDDTEPDGYARTGKYLFLLEMKDTGISEDMLSDFHYDAMIADIEKKFVASTTKKGKERKKAVKQLVRDSKAFYEGAFAFDQLRGQKLDNVVIYPIIVYSGYHFSLPGVNEYVNDVYEKARTCATKPVTMISLDELLLNAVRFRKHGLRNAIDDYHKKRREKVKRFRERGGMNLALKAYAPFEEVTRSNALKSYHADKQFVRDFFRAAELPMN